MSETISFTIDLPVYPERVWRAWLSSAEHSAFTQQGARIRQQVGSEFSTLEGQVNGQITTLVPHDIIAQTWHTAETPEGHIEMTLTPTCSGTELRLLHYGIPTGQSRALMTWWETHYLRPLRTYFETLVGEQIADMGDG